MALTNAYLVTTKNLQSIINSIVSAKAPDRFNNKFLEDLGFKSSNDRLYIGLFKGLGIIDESGVPTIIYHQFIDQSETSFVLAKCIQFAYEDLFNLRKDAQNLTLEEVKGKLKTLTQGQKSEKVIILMANTFKSLCDLAEWKVIKVSEKTDLTLKNLAKGIVEESLEHSKESVLNGKEHSSTLDLNYNIQIHLPETTNLAVYDAIFQSLKKHLF